jgi:hypothetical protein
MNTLSGEQRAALIADLEKSRDDAIAAGEGLSAAQWTWKPSPESWSIGECLEHIAIVERLIVGRVERMIGAEATPDAAAPLADREASIASSARNREHKRQAPEFAKPSGKVASLEEFKGAFEPKRGQAIALIETTEAPLHALVEPHAALGPMTAHQWIWFLSGHCERHAAQAREVRTTPGFPH